MPKKNAGGSKSRFLIIFLVAFIALGASAIAGYTWYELKKVEAKVSSSTELQKAAVAQTPVFMPLETFTVSLKPDADGDRVLYIGVTLRLDNEQSRKVLEEYLPDVRSRLLVLFSQQSAQTLATDEGKKKLRTQIADEINTLVYDHQKAVITDVLYNAFILR